MIIQSGASRMISPDIACARPSATRAFMVLSASDAVGGVGHPLQDCAISAPSTRESAPRFRVTPRGSTVSNQLNPCGKFRTGASSSARYGSSRASRVMARPWGDARRCSRSWRAPPRSVTKPGSSCGSADFPRPAPPTPSAASTLPTDCIMSGGPCVLNTCNPADGTTGPRASGPSGARGRLRRWSTSGRAWREQRRSRRASRTLTR